MSAPHVPHFFIEATQVTSGKITLSGDDARHLVVVRRAKEGDLFYASDGEGLLMLARMTSLAPLVTGEVTEEIRIAKPAPALTVYQALAKGRSVDTAIEKLVEVGVDRIVVFEAGRSVPRWDGARQSRALQRWRSIARGAAKQSRRAWLPEVGGPVSLGEVVKEVRNVAVALVAYGNAQLRMREAIAGTIEGEIALVCGPEGGLSLEEIGVLEGAGARGVSMGPQVLRTETASVVAATLVLHHLGRLG